MAEVTRSSTSPSRQPESYSEYGLGYGIDVTCDSPWRDRGPYIPRKIKAESDFKRKEEACAFEHYRRHIASRKDISLKVHTNITAIDNIAKMGVDAEISRSSCFSLHALGNKIHTCTIDFVTDSSPDLTDFETELQQYTNFDLQKANTDELQEKCKEFVSKNRCTHYIRAIMFGASCGVRGVYSGRVRAY